MKRKKKLIIFTAIAAAVITIILLFILIPGDHLLVRITGPIIVLDSTPRLGNVIQYIQDGDFLLRMTSSAWSMAFREYSTVDKRFSHAAVIRMRDGEVNVIHALGSFSNPDLGVETDPLDRFIMGASSVGIFRVIGADGAVISDTALQYLGRPFDFDFDHLDDSKVYCTELMYHALKPLNLEHILPTTYVEDIKKHAIPIDSISNNPAIHEIVYIVNQREHPIRDDDYITFGRHNPVKNTFIQRVGLFIARIFVSPQQNK
ncbi:MAG: hypothetical protein FWG89_02710 [Treponema sp.]|nr:hypothetical protein [Treponema sp.]